MAVRGPDTAFPGVVVGGMDREQTAGNLTPNWANVKDFGAVGNGANDDTSAIQAAINSLPAQGGTVYVPAGRYKITSTLTLGNGSAAAISTKASIRFIGEGGPTSSTFGDTKAGSVLVWAGGASVMVNLLGPITDCEISGFLFDGAGLANTCLRTDHAERSRFENLEAQGFISEGYIITAYATPVGFGNGANQNVWMNVQALSTSGVVTAMRIGEPVCGTGSLDPAQNMFWNLNIRCLGRGSTGLKLQFTDANTFIASTITATIAVDIIPPTGTGGTFFPAAILYEGFAGAGALTDAISSSTNASPIVITTAVAHGRRNGDYVAIVGHATNTNANGVWKITAASGSVYSLVGSTGNGVGGATGTVQGSGFQQTSGTWQAGTGNTSGLYCPGLNTEGWENFGGFPPLALTGVSGTTMGGISFGSTSRDNAYTMITASGAFSTTGGAVAFSGGGSTFSIPGGFLNRAGVVCLIQAYGKYTTDATPGRTLALAVRLGGNNIAATNLTMGTSATNLPFFMNAELTVRSVGASGSVEITGSSFGAAGGAATQFATGATGVEGYTMDLTAAQLVDFTGNWSAAGQSATITGMKVFIMPARQTT